MTVIKLREVISIIDRFSTDTPHGESTWMKQFFVSNSFCFPRPNYQDKICYMVASEHHEVIEVRRQLIATYIIDPEEAA